MKRKRKEDYLEYFKEAENNIFLHREYVDDIVYHLDLKEEDVIKVLLYLNNTEKFIIKN